MDEHDARKISAIVEQIKAAADCMTDAELIERINAIPYFYHKIELRPGIITPGWAPLAPDAYGIPDDMDGETVLDVGSWDGYWTFEALKRGAKHVTAIDDFSDDCGELIQGKHDWSSFVLCAEALGFAQPRYISAKTVSIEKQNDYYYWDIQVDRVFIFGVLYHLRNPVLALENCFNALKPGGWIHVETAILDSMTSGYTGKPCDPNGCYAEFYPTNEYGCNQSNWWVPTLKCAAAWLKGVGFEDIESWKLTETPQSLAECRGFLRATKR